MVPTVKRAGGAGDLSGLGILKVNEGTQNPFAASAGIPNLGVHLLLKWRRLGE